MVSPGVVSTVLVGMLMLATSCSGRSSGPTASPTTVTPTTAAPGTPPATGACRSELARGSVRGSVIVEWVSLAMELRVGDVEGPVFEARDVRDVGEDAAPTGEGRDAAEANRLVRFGGVRALRGTVPDTPMVTGVYVVGDAQAETAAGGLVLARSDSSDRDGRRYLGTVMVIRPDGSVAFPGDCRPRWAPALESYASRAGLRPAELARALLVDPGGAVAAAFLASPEAATRAGP